LDCREQRFGFADVAGGADGAVDLQRKLQLVPRFFTLAGFDETFAGEPVCVGCRRIRPFELSYTFGGWRNVSVDD
jgi:hypothetical protein